MESAASFRGRQERQSQVRNRAMVRFNGVMFYGVAAASLIEAAAPLHASRLARVFAGQPGLAHWLEQAWQPERAAHGRALRDYVVATWPEFEWEEAYQAFHEAYRLRYECEAGRRSTPVEALGLCVIETQAAVFYRALGRCADDAALRDIMRCAARDHAGYFDRFRQIFEGSRQALRLGFGGAWRELTHCTRAARDREVALAFATLDGHWSGQKTFVELRYGEFLQRMGALVHHHAALGPVERFLFRPWMQPQAGMAVAGGAAAVLAPGTPSPRVAAETLRPLARAA